MVNSKKLIAGLGVVAGLGVAMLPLTSYAVDATEVASGSDGLTHVVRATVASVFTIKVNSNMDIQENNTTAVALGDTRLNTSALKHTIQVVGNVYGGYDLTMSPASEVLGTDLLFVKDSSKTFGTTDRYDANVKIATGTDIDGSHSNWAFKKAEKTQAGAEGTYGDWTAIAANTNLKSNLNTENGKFDDTVYVQFGISAAEGQPAGTYEGQVVYKATSKI
ncbi:hypothetical protein IJ380_02735 [Candidatus Saccharibacteria bacterium]|nr:hypothetical protein [Candidatus Saccharibacteria bacterium]